VKIRLGPHLRGLDLLAISPAAEPELIRAHTNIVSGLKALSIPVYGQVFSQAEANKFADHFIEAATVLPESPSFRNKVKAAAAEGVEDLLKQKLPEIKAEVRKEAGSASAISVTRLLIGAGLLAVGAWGGFAIFKVTSRKR